MIDIIKNPVHLDRELMEGFVAAFRADNYEIVTSDPSIDNMPAQLSETQLDPVTYQMILDDPSAGINYFSVRYSTGSGKILAPAGLYGISNRRKLRFPLITNDTWQVFLMMDRSRFSLMADIHGDECDLYYKKLIELKRSFIRKVFQYYFLLDPGYCSAMAWTIRGEKSNTRSIAESLSFLRFTFKDMEVYTTVPAEPESELWKYIRNCVFRWDIISKEESVLSRNDHSVPKQIDPGIRFFVRSLVGYTG